MKAANPQRLSSSFGPGIRVLYSAIPFSVLYNEKCAYIQLQEQSKDAIQSGEQVPVDCEIPPPRYGTEPMVFFSRVAKQHDTSLLRYAFLIATEYS